MLETATTTTKQNKQIVKTKIKQTETKQP